MANGDVQIGQSLGLALRGIIDRLSGRQEDVLRTQQAAQRIESGESRENVLTPEIARAAERSQVGSIGTVLGKIPGFEQVPVLGRIASAPEVFPRGPEGNIQFPKSEEQANREQTIQILQDLKRAEGDVSQLSPEQQARLKDDKLFDFAQNLGIIPSEETRALRALREAGDFSALPPQQQAIFANKGLREVAKLTGAIPPGQGADQFSISDLPVAITAQVLAGRAGQGPEALADPPSPEEVANALNKERQAKERLRQLGRRSPQERSLGVALEKAKFKIKRNDKIIEDIQKKREDEGFLGDEDKKRLREAKANLAQNIDELETLSDKLIDTILGDQEERQQGGAETERQQPEQRQPQGQQQAQTGRIPVRRLSDGVEGTIPADEFDPQLFERIE